MGAGSHALAGFRRRQTCADRKSAAETLGERHHVRRDAGALVRKKFAAASDASLHFVERQQQAVLIANLAQLPQKFVRHNPHAAFTHDRLDQDASGLRPDGALDRVEVAVGHLVEAIDRGTETVEIFLVAGRGQRREGAAVESAFKRNNPVFLRVSADRVVLAHDLEGGLDRFGAGVAEEHKVGE